MCRPEFDDKDAELLKVREAKHNAMDGPQVGDYVQMPGEDGLRRFTHDWGDSLQTTVGPKSSCFGDVSFYIDRDGECNFSGSLDPSISKDKIVPVAEEDSKAEELLGIKLQKRLNGSVWFFHHDWPGAHCGVYARIAFKVWEYKP